MPAQGALLSVQWSTNSEMLVCVCVCMCSAGMWLPFPGSHCHHRRSKAAGDENGGCPDGTLRLLQILLATSNGVSPISKGRRKKMHELRVVWAGVCFPQTVLAFSQYVNVFGTTPLSRKFRRIFIPHWRPGLCGREDSSGCLRFRERCKFVAVHQTHSKPPPHL